MPMARVVEPSGVRARMREQDNERSLLRRLIALPRPLAHCLAVRWIAKDAMIFPILHEAIVFLGEEGGTGRIFLGCARIKRELEFRVQFVEEGPCRGPLISRHWPVSRSHRL
jgi:hypothetical protein